MVPRPSASLSGEGPLFTSFSASPPKPEIFLNAFEIPFFYCFQFSIVCVSVSIAYIHKQTSFSVLQRDTNNSCQVTIISKRKNRISCHLKTFKTFNKLWFNHSFFQTLPLSASIKHLDLYSRVIQQFTRPYIF